ncbi:translation initiation factor IF-2-like [Meles meles]|uniref:translation initiation factor IF-2-like n=1 Tax=Meles meles TaxID=9662 RepID=UPI001E699DCC|nr:translation initiation factor IF-2-like [Meles meles]
MSRRPAGPRAPARLSARPGSSSARLRWVGRAPRLAVGGPCPAGGARCRPCLLLSASGLGLPHWTFHAPPGAGLAARTRALHSGSPPGVPPARLLGPPDAGAASTGPEERPSSPGGPGSRSVYPAAAGSVGGGGALPARCPGPPSSAGWGSQGAEPAAEQEGGPGPWAPGSGSRRLSSLGCALSSGARDPNKFRPQVGCGAGGGRRWECRGRRWASGSRGLRCLRPASRASSPPPGSRAGPRLTPSHRQSPRHPSPGLLPGAGTVTSAPASRSPGVLARPLGRTAPGLNAGVPVYPHPRRPGGAPPAPFPRPSTPPPPSPGTGRGPQRGPAGVAQSSSPLGAPSSPARSLELGARRSWRF